MKLITDKPTRKHFKFLRERGYTLRSNIPELQRLGGLKRKLLSLGGYAVILPAMEDDLTRILERGTLERRYKMMKGEPCNCHNNSALLWDANRDKVLLCTGYALSKDGLWRQHSWGFDPRTNFVIETTVGRVAYFGYCMTDDEAEKFYDANL